MQAQLLDWYDRTARALPWRGTRDPYAIWVSEIMLQQTRSETVIAYWTRFLAQYPTIQALAAAPEQDVLKAWEGLGYYGRARNLRRCAQAITEAYDGLFPSDTVTLRSLPGIGEYTAGAVSSIAFGVRTPAVDGNVERVISRLRGIREDIGIPSVRRRLRAEADALVPSARPGDYNQAMMELGARVCQPVPRCPQCPISAFCDAYDAGDADTLPRKQRKAAQRVVPLGMALVFNAGRVLLYPRTEKLLQGLWSFPAAEGTQMPGDVQKTLAEHGIFAQYAGPLGEARHTFTHLIWDMRLLRFDAPSDACPEGWRWANRAALDALPLPTAVKAARTAADGLLA